MTPSNSFVPLAPANLYRAPLTRRGALPPSALSSAPLTHDPAEGRLPTFLGFLTAIIIIFIMGTIARNVVGRRILARVERLFEHVPIFRSIYPSVKQLLESFSPQQRNSFKAVVLAEHPRKGEYVFGFVTSELLIEGAEGKRAMVTVFVPTNNLYLGDVIVVAKDETLPTGLTVEEGIRIILSAGTATPPRLPRERL